MAHIYHIRLLCQFLSKFNVNAKCTDDILQPVVVWCGYGVFDKYEKMAFIYAY